MELYKKLVIDRPWLALAVVLLFCVLAASQARNFQIDASADALVLEGDEDLEFYRGVVKRFGSSEFLILAYELSHPIMSDQTLESLDALVKDLSGVDGVTSVTSILDVPLLYSPKVSIAELGAGLNTLRTPGVDRELVGRELVESPIYRQLLSSLDESTTAIQVNIAADKRYGELLEKREMLRKQVADGELDTSERHLLDAAEREFKAYSPIATERQQRIVADVREVVNKHKSKANQIYVGGVPMIANDMVAFVMNDLATFGTGILVFIVLLLSVIFRELRWVVLPIVACVATNLLMFGVLGGFDWRMTVISSNFVALLLIITLAISVHLIVRYRELEAQDPDRPSDVLAFETAKAMFRPCVYTVLTTIIAFASLVISGIRPVIDFGWMMTVGVMLALAVTFLLVPAGMALGWGARSSATSVDSAQSAAEDVFTLRFASFAERYGRAVLIFALVVLVVAVAGIARLKVENRFIDYFDESTEIYRGMELIDSQLGGTIPLDIILTNSALTDDLGSESSLEFVEDSVGESAAGGDDDFDDFADFEEPSFDDEVFDDEFGFDDGALLSGGAAAADGEMADWFTRAGMDKVQTVHDYLNSLPQTGKVLSLSTLYVVAKDLLGGSVDDIQLSFARRGLPAEINEIMVDPYLHQASGETRISVRVKETSRSLNRNQLLEQLDQHMQEELGFSSDQYRFSGMLVLYNNMLQSLFTSQILTLGAVFLAITAMLFALFRNFLVAVLGIFPNLLAALLVLGGMGWFGLPLDLMTITIAAISIGIGVDNTIHYLYRFRMEYEKDRLYLAAMYRSHGSIGRAMYYTSLTIIFGFSILALSNFKPSIYFGLLTGAAMLSALLGALLLLPRLLILFKPFGPAAESP